MNHNHIIGTVTDFAIITIIVICDRRLDYKKSSSEQVLKRTKKGSHVNRRLSVRQDLQIRKFYLTVGSLF